MRKLLKLATKDYLAAHKAHHYRDNFSPAAGLRRPPVLLELASFALENSLVEFAQECVSEVPQEAVQDIPHLLLQWETLQTQLLVIAESSKAGGGVYTLAAVEARVRAMGHLEWVLTSAIKLADCDLVEVRRECFWLCWGEH